MSKQIKKEFQDNGMLTVSGLGDYNLTDTMECGQCFRWQVVKREKDYVEYLIPVGKKLFSVAQKKPGELIFYRLSDEDFEDLAVTFFSLGTDYEKIKNDIRERTDSEWLLRAIDAAGGIAILKQDAWEALFSFIVSQNNNIPRIRKIIAEISRAYGANLCLQNGIKKCPLSKIDTAPCDENCKKCGICYSFPSPDEIFKNPEKMLESKPGFRYKYLCDAARRVVLGEVSLSDIEKRGDYNYTLTELKKILGVGDKVASCVALFGFGNLEAFPVDVWMKRAIDMYFDGKLDPSSLGRYAGVAQQYIFHYIRLQNS